MTTIQTNPKAFNRSLPVYKVTSIDRASSVVTLSGPGGKSVKVALNSWGPSEETQPKIGSQVQLLEDETTVNR
jgi:hypothetical protein